MQVTRITEIELETMSPAVASQFDQVFVTGDEPGGLLFKVYPPARPGEPIEISSAGGLSICPAAETWLAVVVGDPGSRSIRDRVGAIMMAKTG